MKPNDMVESVFYIITTSDDDSNALAYKRILELFENVLANASMYFKEWTCFDAFQSGTYVDDMVTDYFDEGRRFQLFTEPRYAAYYARGIAKKESLSKCAPELLKLADLFEDLPTSWEKDRKGADYADRMAECFFNIVYALALPEEKESARAFVDNLNTPVNID